MVGFVLIALRRRLARGRGRAHAVVGGSAATAVARRVPCGTDGDLAAQFLRVSALSEWRRLLAQKRQDALRAKRRAKAHAQVGLLLAQWERGQDARALVLAGGAGFVLADGSRDVLGLFEGTASDSDTERAAVASLAARLEGHSCPGLYDDPLALVRYLRARNWNVELAEALIQRTGEWRKDFGFADVFKPITEELERECRLANIYVRGYDKKGRPALYFKPGGQGFNAEHAGVKYLVYCVERAIACLEKQAKLGHLVLHPEDPVARKFVLLVDFQGVSTGSLLPLTIARDLLQVMQDHYPERLGVAIFVNTPWLLHGFFNAASNFLDPVTVAKFTFVSATGEELSRVMAEHFELSALEPSFGGSDDEPFCSHVFLNTPAGQTVFGLEFSEQLQLCPEHECGGAEYVDFLHVYRHWRVLKLAPSQRRALRQLVKELGQELPQEDKDFFIDASTLLRYLRAQSWDVAKAAAAVHATARWRKEHVSEPQGKWQAALVQQCALGRLYLRGFDKQGRPILYAKFHHEDGGGHQETLNYVIYVMERLLALLRRLEEDQDEAPDCATMIVDLSSYASSNRPQLKTLWTATRIVKEHYPEIFGDVYVFQPPVRISFLWDCLPKIRCGCLPQPMYQLLDPHVRDKVTVVTSQAQWKTILQSKFERSKLERSFGGDLKQQFTSKTFLNKKSVRGSIYGCEFEEQAAAPEAQRQRVSFRFSSKEEIPITPIARCESAEEDGGFSIVDNLTWIFR
ncbi:unnamed protein product [Effrenium voratum]|nr:unnamed protein product [Effrenium voratum]